MITEIRSVQNYMWPFNNMEVILSFKNIHMLQGDNSRLVSHRKCSAMMNNMSCTFFIQSMQEMYSGGEPLKAEIFLIEIVQE